MCCDFEYEFHSIYAKIVGAAIGPGTAFPIRPLTCVSIAALLLIVQDKSLFNADT